MKKPKWLSQNLRLFKCATSCANKVGNTALQTCVFSGNANFQVPSICGPLLAITTSSRKKQTDVFSSDRNCRKSKQMHKTKLIFTFGIILSCFFVHRATMFFEVYQYRMFSQTTVSTFAQRAEMINAPCRMTIVVSFR